jgi:pyridoxine 4-dehydrogenase
VRRPVRLTFLVGQAHDLLDRDGGIALLRKAVEAGVTLIDTADVYGPHTNERLIRDALRPYPEHLVVATKGGFVRVVRSAIVQR